MDKIITISREYGAGGHSIGQQVAKELGIPFYDRDILKATVQTSGFDPDMVEHDQEDVSSTNFFFKSICSFADASFSDTQDAIHDVQKAVILHFAKEGPCVILGRCADEILREAGMESLNVFIHADAVHRAVRASELTGCTDATAITTTWYWIAASWAIPCAPSLSSKRPRANKGVKSRERSSLLFFKYKLTGSHRKRGTDHGSDNAYPDGGLGSFETGAAAETAGRP